MKYMSACNQAILRKSSACNYYLEELEECFGINSSAFWTHEIDKEKPLRKSYFFEDEIESFQEAKELMNCHEPTIKSFI